MNIRLTDLEIEIADALYPHKSHLHPENKFDSETLQNVHKIARFIRDRERVLNDFLLKESNGEHTEFRLVVNPDGTFYSHVLGSDSKTIDGNLLKEHNKEWSYYYQKWLED